MTDDEQQKQRAYQQERMREYAEGIRLPAPPKRAWALGEKDCRMLKSMRIAQE